MRCQVNYAARRRLGVSSRVALPSNLARVKGASEWDRSTQTRLTALLHYMEETPDRFQGAQAKRCSASQFNRWRAKKPCAKPAATSRLDSLGACRPQPVRRGYIPKVDCGRLPDSTKPGEKPAASNMHPRSCHSKEAEIMSYFTIPLIASENEATHNR